MTLLTRRREQGDTLQRGETVAALLAGSWRRTPPVLTLDSTIVETVTPLLARSGAGGLAWYRLRETALRTSRSCQELRQHYRLQALQAINREEALTTLLPRLRAAGVEPILIKGWSSARLYPEPALRPSSDVDLCVSAGQLETACAALSASPLPCAVDLHANVPDLDRPWPQLFRHSQMVALAGIMVRVLGPEDQLRLLCLHLARHGLARPLWLCDIGACLESLPPTFDDDYFRRGQAHLTEWTRCVMELAHQLLDARLDSRTAASSSSKYELAPWIKRAVLWCWGVGVGRPLGHYLRQPLEIVRRLRYRGLSPNGGSMPIQAALQLGLGPTEHLPLLLVQLAGFVRRKVPHVLQRLLHPQRRRVQPFAIHHH